MVTRIGVIVLGLLLLSSHAEASCPDKLHCFLMGAAITIHGADLGTTENCIGAEKCVEMNKWLGRFNQPAIFGGVVMAQTAVTEWAVDKLHDDHPRLAHITHVGIIVGYSFVVANNVKQTRRPTR